MENKIQELLDSEKDETVELADELTGKVTARDYFSVMAEDIEKFDERAWDMAEGYKTPKFQSISENLEGWESGLYVFAGPSNAGKTAIMLNIMEDLCTHAPNKLFGLYFSIDDNKNKVIPRLVAMRESIPIGIVAKPGRYKKLIENGDGNALYYSECLKKREEGLAKLKEDGNKMMVLDATDMNDVDSIYECIKQVQNYVKSIDPDANVIIGMDSIKDIVLSERYGKMSTNEKSDDVARIVKHWTVELDIIILTSMHLRKLNANRRPTMDDLKDSNVLEYELSCCFLVYNDVSRNKQSAKIYHRDSEEGEKLPVIEVDWGKNKVTGYKGRTFCYFSSEFSKAVECGEEASRRFNGLLYEA
jgi:replicative DNA helicase